MAERLVLPIQADILVSYLDARNELTREPIKGATATMTLKDALGQVVTGAQDVPLPAVDGTISDYAGVLPKTLSLVEDANYDLEVTFDSADADDFRKLPCVAKFRGQR